MTSERDRQLAALAGADVEAARGVLLDNEGWLSGEPPAAFIELLIEAYLRAADAPIDVARAWDPTAMGRALLDRLSESSAEKDTEACAWLLAQVSPPALIGELVAAAADERLLTVARRWLCTAIDRLALAGLVRWSSVADLVASLSGATEATLRLAASGISGSFAESEEATAILLTLLDDEEASVVESALHQLGLRDSPAVPPRIIELVSDPRPGIAERAAALVARSKS